MICLYLLIGCVLKMTSHSWSHWWIRKGWGCLYYHGNIFVKFYPWKLKHYLLPNVTASQFSAKNFLNTVFVTGFLTFWLLGLFVSALHEDYILRFCRLCISAFLFFVFVVFVIFVVLNQEADPSFRQSLADSGRNLLISPNRLGSLF